MKIILATQGAFLIRYTQNMEYCTIYEILLCIWITDGHNCLLLGLGGVLPSIDLSCFHGDVMDSMMSEVLGAASSAGSYASDAASSFLDTVHYNEEQAKTAYSFVFKFICDIEGGGGSNWKPLMTGLTLTEAPEGKVRSMWVSIEGM